MRVLITGASGLLGSRMMEHFPQDWELTGTCHSNEVPGLLRCDLLDCRQGKRLLQAGGFDWLVHCAANRQPDECEESPRAAMAINAEATEWLSRAAADCGCRMLYASTDYVFSGDDPPYTEKDRPNPVNAYGHSKLAGEEHTLCVPGGLVVRIPALYSLDLDAPNNLLAGLRARLCTGETVQADQETVRYYTLAEDVAAACGYLMGQDYHGVVHVSAEERTTKHEFLSEAAGALGADPEQVQAVPAGGSAAPRPHNSHLDTSLYRSLGGPSPRGWREALRLLRGGSAEDPQI
jgi:dTDP-4-dehydrorhamnose reductase